MKRRQFLFLAVLATSLGAAPPARAAEDLVTVYKSPS